MILWLMWVFECSAQLPLYWRLVRDREDAVKLLQLLGLTTTFFAYSREVPCIRGCFFVREHLCSAWSLRQDIWNVSEKTGSIQLPFFLIFLLFNKKCSPMTWSPTAQASITQLPSCMFSRHGSGVQYQPYHDIWVWFSLAKPYIVLVVCCYVLSHST